MSRPYSCRVLWLFSSCRRGRKTRGARFNCDDDDEAKAQFSFVYTSRASLTTTSRRNLYDLARTRRRCESGVGKSFCLSNQVFQKPAGSSFFFGFATLKEIILESLKNLRKIYVVLVESCEMLRFEMKKRMKGELSCQVVGSIFGQPNTIFFFYNASDEHSS